MAAMLLYCSSRSKTAQEVLFLLPVARRSGGDREGGFWLREKYRSKTVFLWPKHLYFLGL
ncbi:hypothetical protein CS546_06380 [Porphyromonas gingivalis]|nr:hypothetical protein CS546_06380 [Porphyromonas gingivalis]ATS00404.1 hypothetical protein CS549_04540 [Porphyromonas gingivalis]